MTLSLSDPIEPGDDGFVIRINGPDGDAAELPGFVHQPFRRQSVARGGRPADWIYPDGSPRWEARFTPMRAGEYRVAARLVRNGRMQESAPVSFHVEPSDHPGFLRVREDVPRFLVFDNGTPFFAIGQNLCYFGEGQFVNLARGERLLHKLAASGVNYLRVWTCCNDWALSLEGRKSAWGRSWGWNPPFAADPLDPAAPRCVQLGGEFPLLQRIRPCRPVAVMPDTDYLLGGECLVRNGARLVITSGGAKLSSSQPESGRWSRFECPLRTRPGQQWLDEPTIRLADDRGSVWIRSLALTEAAGGANLLRDAAIDQKSRGVIDPVDAFMLDELVAIAEREEIYLQLCLLVRDPYTDDLREPGSAAYQAATATAREVLGQIAARWGWSTHVAAWEYFNETDPGRPTAPFYEDLAASLDHADPYGHPRTTSTWSPSRKDWRLPALDIAQTHHYIRPAIGAAEHDAVQAFLGQLRPMLAESGAKPVMVGEFGLADDTWRLSPFMAQDVELVHFHRTLWASTMSGAAGTALFWWWKELDEQNAYPHYRSLAGFLERARFPDPALATFDRDIGNVRVLGWAGPQRTIAWLSDRRATWHAAVVGNEPAGEVAGVALPLPGLQPGTYRICWWDTWPGKVLAEQRVTLAKNDMKLPVPRFRRDLAVLVEPVADSEAETSRRKQ